VSKFCQIFENIIMCDKSVLYELLFETGTIWVVRHA